MSATVGVLGGGQLGRMLALAGLPLGVRCLVVEPASGPPVAPVAEVIAAPYDDPGALEQLARRCDVVTVELEGVPVEALEWLAERVAVHPGAEAVAVAQDRLVEKRRLAALGIATAPFGPWPPDGGTEALPDGEGIVKTRRGGFDGRGQRRITCSNEVPLAVAQLGGAAVVVEGRVDFVRELAVVAARGRDGTFAPWPVVDTHHVDGILSTARVSGRHRDAAEALARKVAEDVDYVGVFAVELFDTDAGLVANEWAPRVHNSGHWTIEGAVTSQFEQHLRAILGWPLGDPSPVGVSGTVNVIGSSPDPAAVLAVPGAHLHLYDKAPRPGRKLGHVTITAPDDATLDARLTRLASLV